MWSRQILKQFYISLSGKLRTTRCHGSLYRNPGGTSCEQMAGLIHLEESHIIPLEVSGFQSHNPPALMGDHTSAAPDGSCPTMAPDDAKEIPEHLSNLMAPDEEDPCLLGRLGSENQKEGPGLEEAGPAIKKKRGRKRQKKQQTSPRHKKVEAKEDVEAGDSHSLGALFSGQLLLAGCEEDKKRRGRKRKRHWVARRHKQKLQGEEQVEEEDSFNLDALFSGQLLVASESSHGIITGKANRTKKKKKKKCGEGISEKMNKQRPNYFIGVQVSNPQIHCAVRKLQETILEAEPRLASTIISVPTLHLTLMVMCLENEDDVEGAKTALEDCQSQLMEEMSGSQQLSLEFEGLSNFNNAVLFVDLKDEAAVTRLRDLAGIIKQSMEKYDVLITDQRELNPHLTVLKLSKDPRLRYKGIKKISSSTYQAMASIPYGTQTVRGVQLLSMDDDKDEHGYYQKLKEINFDIDVDESQDHTECCSKPLVNVSPKHKRGSPGKQSSASGSKLLEELNTRKEQVRTEVRTIVVDQLSEPAADVPEKKDL